MLRLWIIFFTCAFAALYPAAASAENPPQPRPGLMWNRTGLPAVFPLQVKTPPGSNYFLTLLDAEDGTPWLAAFISGGQYFKVLVPPGSYRLRFAAGQIWRGETELFGPGDKTRVFDMPAPLTFRTRGYGTKAGHVITLSADAQGDLAMLRLRGQYICQTLDTSYGRAEPLPWLVPDVTQEDRSWRFTGSSPKAEDLSPFEPQIDPDTPYRLYSLTPQYSVRSRTCS